MNRHIDSDEVRSASRLSYESAPARPRIYLPELDGVRFLAFFLVLLSHERPVAGLFWPGSSADIFIGSVCRFGWIGVDVFLVLSAYLLTTLLLAEGDRTGSIGIGRFYLRRALRIWPLYYPYLFAAMFVYMPLQGYAVAPIARHQLFPFAVFLGNYSYWYYLNYLNDSFAHLWTVCMEEQFYIVLPVILYFARGWSVRKIVAALATATALALGCRGYAILNETPYPFIWSTTICRLDAVTAGIVAALVTRSGHRLPGYPLLLASAVLFATVVAPGQIGTTANSWWQSSAADLCAACLILGSLSTRLGTLVFANRPARYLGRISYGLYVYHEVCLHLVWQWTDGWFPGHAARAWLVSLAITLSLDIAVSTISYLAWERRFIVVKNRFETVRSRPA